MGNVTVAEDPSQESQKVCQRCNIPANSTLLDTWHGSIAQEVLAMKNLAINLNYIFVGRTTYYDFYNYCYIILTSCKVIGKMEIVQEQRPDPSSVITSVYSHTYYSRVPDPAKFSIGVVMSSFSSSKCYLFFRSKFYYLKGHLILADPIRTT
ncbi:unnamed protein product [Pieris brassicae]|uniref:Uncharacterized protein n=1 Tax=Pieris brassicae TaxID=7116 RepID=A0A9P0X4G9_PIEBR|nr:unnamed protein product [Pieris brassicae]